MAVLRPSVNKMEIGGNLSYSLPMILTYRQHPTDSDGVYLKIHLNKNILELMSSIPDISYAFWIERGGRYRSTNQSGGRKNRHYSKVGKFRIRTRVLIFTKSQLNDLITNDSVPEVLISKKDYLFSCFHTSGHTEQTYLCLRGTVRVNDQNYESIGVNSNEIKIDL